MGLVLKDKMEEIIISGIAKSKDIKRYGLVEASYKFYEENRKI